VISILEFSQYKTSKSAGFVQEQNYKNPMNFQINVVKIPIVVSKNKGLSRLSVTDGRYMTK